jgi:leader peptidase (prepilin peptidase) / N-methyltransferase
MTPVLAAACGVFGLLVGSFLNVVIHRVPRDESVVRPRSRCPQCGTQLAERDNIPVVSWLVLRGRCRTCSAPISARYPLVEALTGVLFAALALRFGFDWALPAFLVATAGLVALSLIDLDTFLLPKKVHYPTLIATAVLLAAAAVIDADWQGAREAAIGSLGAFALLFVIHFVSPRGMGFGDVRLAALLGLVLGWIELGAVPLGLFLGFLLGAVVGVGLMLGGRKGRKDRIPFGPFLAAGALLAVLFSDPLLDLYLGR